jgi:hypothetical protein
MKRIALPLLAAALVASCTLPETGEYCATGAVSRLYLGQSTPNGFVTETQWRDFVEQSIATRFPQGFTELRAHGRWRNGGGESIEEGTRIIEIVHDDVPPVRERVGTIASEYRRRFAQESVLVTRARSYQCFSP